MYLLSTLVFGVSVGLAFADLPANYESLTADKKQDILWDKISADPYPIDNLPSDSNSVFVSLNLLKPSFDQKAFTWDGDEMIKDRPKVIHTYGSAAKTELQINANSKYTGVFAPGNKASIARLSLAAIQKDNFTPGMALKVLVNGKPSINMFAMFSLDGQGPDYNFFKNTFTNFVPDAKSIALKVGSRAFHEAIEDLPGGDCDRPLSETKLPLLIPGSQHVNGSFNVKPKPPMVYFFQPNTALGWDSADKSDLRTKLAKIPVGSVLYTFAVSATDGGPKEVIGKLVLKSPFVASEYQDKTLFFKHHAKSC